VGFLLRLPTNNWNGKFIEQGCGGYCGNYRFITWCDNALRRGYTCIVSDGGHKSARDAKWAYNNLQAEIDLGFRAPHVTAIAGKAITERYYSQTPKKSYFMGCSTGGRQALMEAQRFPWDFDGWKPEDFDFDRDYKRLGIAEGLYAAGNPDLRKFKAAGGKLISYTGWNDAAGMPLAAADYYEIAEKALGGRAATQDFFRLFMLPGVDHCSGGDGAFAVDWLSYLEAWVEKHQAPDKIISSHVKLDNHDEAYQLKFPLDPARIEFSRPVFPYPTRVQYSGYGDPKDAASFGPAKSL